VTDSRETDKIEREGEREREKETHTYTQLDREGGEKKRSLSRSRDGRSSRAPPTIRTSARSQGLLATDDRQAAPLYATASRSAGHKGGHVTGARLRGSSRACAQYFESFRQPLRSLDFLNHAFF